MLPSTTTHVVFLLHGLWGNPTHMYTLRDALNARADALDCNLLVVCCKSYQRSKSFDGVDICADRVIHEITDRITETRKSGSFVQKFSILGYSLGGLIARVVVKHLTSTMSSVLKGVELCNFATFASPAIGIPNIASPISKKIQDISAFFLSRSGEHLYLRDGQKGLSKPLLYQLATPEYTDAVNRFKNVDVYVNCVADGLVPYISGAMGQYDPFLPALERARKLEMHVKGDRLTLDNLALTFDHEYPSILTAVRLSQSTSLEQASPPDGESEACHDDLDAPVFHGPLKPSTCQRIRPWFLPTTYRFLPHPLNYAFVASIPFVIPAIPLAVGAITYQKCASSVRIKRHFRSHSHPPVSHITDANSEAGRKDLDESTVAYADATPHATTIEASQPTTMDINGLSPPNTQPILSDMQLEIAEMLRESLGSRMRLHLAFIPNVWNSHAVIICQNPKHPEHILGKSAVQHWAHHFAY